MYPRVNHISKTLLFHTHLLQIRYQIKANTSGVTAGGRQGAECPPETSDREIFGDVSGKKGKRGENCEREGVKLEMEVGKVIKQR